MPHMLLMNKVHSNSVNLIILIISVKHTLYLYQFKNYTTCKELAIFHTFDTLLNILRMVLRTFFPISYTTILLLYFEFAIYNLKAL